MSERGGLRDVPDGVTPGAIGSVRAGVRAILLVGIVVALFPVALVSRVAGLVAPGAGMRLGARVQAWWARASLVAAGIRVKVDGASRLPAGGCLICSNHRGYVDVLVLAATIPGRFVAMREIRGWPVFGWMSRSSGTLFLAREDRRALPAANDEVARTMANGVPVIVFPEGRAGAGDRLLPLRSPLLDPAARSGAPCVAVALRYQTPGVPYSTAWTVSWWGGMDLSRHAWRLLRMRRVEALVTVAPAHAVPRVPGDRKALAAAVEKDLLAALPTLSLSPEPPDNPWRGMRPPSSEGAETAR